ALHAPLGDDVVVLFDYVDGARLGPPFVFGGERLGGLLARLHSLSDRVALPLARESFDRPDGRLLWRTLARAREEPAVDEAGRALRRFVGERGRAIEDDWATLGELASACRSASPEPVLTHGD